MPVAAVVDKASHEEMKSTAAITADKPGTAHESRVRTETSGLGLTGSARRHKRSPPTSPNYVSWNFTEASLERDIIQKISYSRRQTDDDAQLSQQMRRLRIASRLPAERFETLFDVQNSSNQICRLPLNRRRLHKKRR